MAFPTDLEIEVAFNNDFDEAVYAQSGWTSVLPFVASFSGDLRGREHELDKSEAGTVNVVLDNSDSRFIPGSVQSPYYPNVKSNRRFRIRGKNMVHPNVARGGGRDHDTTGLIDFASLGLSSLLTPSTTFSVQAVAMDSVRVITASAEPNAPAQGKEKLNDGLATTKWTINTQDGAVTYKLGVPVRITRYTLTIPAGNPNNNPKTWTLQGSNDGTSFSTVDTVTNNTWGNDYESQEFIVDTPGSYLYYKLDITANVGATTNTQLAEFKINYDNPITDLPIGNTDLTYYFEVRKPANQTVLSTFHKTIAWFIPIEYGVRLAHSAYIWRVSGTEPTGTKVKIGVEYYDNDWNFIPGSQNISNEISTLPISTTPTQIGFNHAPPATAKYAVLYIYIFIPSTTNTTDLVYGITGAQSELPANLAPDVSGFRDQFNWQMESDSEDIGTYINVGSDSSTSYLSVSWGFDDKDLFITIPHLIPGETYTATIEAQKVGSAPDVLFSGDEGKTGALINTTSFTQYWTTFVVEQAEQELRFILQGIPNLITPTATFESGVTGWSSVNATFVQDTNQFFEGLASGLLTANNAPNQAFVRPATFNVAFGNEYKASFWAYSITGKLIGCAIDWYNGVTYLDTVIQNFTIPPNQWTYCEVVATANVAGTTKATFGPTIGSSVVVNGDQLWIDNANFNSTSLVEGFRLRKLKVESGNNPALTLPSSGLANSESVSTWARPKDIFEGWIEAWPAVGGSSEMTITVVDRLKRIGDIELSNTLKEALLTDDPKLLLPLSDSMLDTLGRFSQLGTWANEEDGPTYVDITHTRGDITGASYTTSTDDGPTGEASLKLTNAASNKGYFLTIPYSKDFAAPGGGSTPPPAPTPPPPSTPTVKATYTKKWYATWSRSYEGDNSTRFDDSPYMYQGSFDVSSPGNQKSLAGFDYKNIQATLKGAEILEAYFTIKNVHARWNKGLYAQVGTHNYSSKPSTWNGTIVAERRWKNWVTEGGTLTINIGTVIGRAFRDGSVKGIAIGPEATNDHDNYGYFAGATQSGKPVLTVKYRK